MLALIDSSTAIAGDAKEVRAAIDRHAQAPAGTAALISRVDTLRAVTASGDSEKVSEAGALARRGRATSHPLTGSNSVWLSIAGCGSARKSMCGPRKMPKKWPPRCACWRE